MSPPSSSSSSSPGTSLSHQANPTTRLPPLRSHPPSAALLPALFHLSLLYSPHSLTTSERHRASSASFTTDSSEEGKGQQEWDDALDAARVDESERRYAMSWLTRLVGSGLHWLSTEEEGQGGSEEILDLAARVLGGHAALEDAGAITRVFDLPLPLSILPREEEGKSCALGNVRVEMRDESLPPSESRAAAAKRRPNNNADRSSTASGTQHRDDNDDNDDEDESRTAAEAVGVQTWAAAVVLSDMVLCRPELFHSDFAALSPSSSSSVEVATKPPIRIHELGAGTGLVGMAVAKGLQNVRWRAEVTLSDFHDQVLDNLRYNLEQNFSSGDQQDDDGSGEGEGKTVEVRVEKVDWSLLHSRLSMQKDGEGETKKEETKPSNSTGQSQEPTTPSHLLLAADVIYDPQHARWLRSTILQLLLHPSDEALASPEEGWPRSRAHILIALRTSGKFEGLHHSVKDAFGLYTPHPVSSTESDEDGQTEWDLRILKVTRLEKRRGLGRDDEQGYLWFEIGWVRV